MTDDEGEVTYSSTVRRISPPSPLDDPRPAGWPREQPAAEYDAVWHLSFKQSSESLLGDITRVAGYDWDKHVPTTRIITVGTDDPDSPEQGHIDYVAAEAGSTVQTHFEYQPLTPEQMTEVLEAQLRRNAEDEIMFAARQSTPEWEPRLVLSYEDSQSTRNWMREVSNLPGYDPDKHDFGIGMPSEISDYPDSPTHIEYRRLEDGDSYGITFSTSASGPPVGQPLVGVADWEIRRYLSYEESDSGYSSDPTGVPGYDPTKHDPSPTPFHQYIIPSVDPSDGEQGHFEYHPRIEYPEPEPQEPIVATVDTETLLEVEVPAGEGLTYVYWEPLDWESRFPTDEWGMSLTDDDPSFMQVEDMEALWVRPTQGVIGTKVNKIIIASGTDPARYEINEWDPNLAKYKLILKRHDSMPVERLNQGLIDSSVDDMTITGAHFEEEGTLKVQISDQAWLFESTHFMIPPGGYRLLVTGWNRRQEDETVAIDMWPSEKADDPDEVLKTAEWY